MKYFRKHPVQGRVGKIINSILGKDIVRKVVEIHT